MIRIIVGGDVCPAGRNLRLFERGEAGKLFNDLLPIFENADLTIVNLEGPLVREASPIEKNGPVLGGPISCVNGLKAANINIVNLANNHILDHGSDGFQTTIEVCQRNGITCVGGGMNSKEARKILIRCVNNIRIGVLGVAEHEFSIATTASPGANPYNLIDIVRNIETERKNFDYLIVLFHGGVSQYPFPSPRLMETCRFLVERGANAVICQHSHSVGCWEDYRGGHIVYGQGNLIFDADGLKPLAWCQGVLVKLEISAKIRSIMELVPFEQARGREGSHLLQPKEAEALLREAGERSEKIQVPGFVREQWLRYCWERRNSYLSSVLGHSRLLRRLNRNGNLVRLLYSKKALLAMQNVINCEDHREALETIFEEWRLMGF